MMAINLEDGDDDFSEAVWRSIDSGQDDYILWPPINWLKGRRKDCQRHNRPKKLSHLLNDNICVRCSFANVSTNFATSHQPSARVTSINPIRCGGLET